MQPTAQRTIVRALRTVRAAGPGGISTADYVVAVGGKGPNAAGGSAAALSQLERYGLLVSNGAPMNGQPNGHRRWWLTQAGVDYLAEALRPPPGAVIT